MVSGTPIENRVRRIVNNNHGTEIRMFQNSPLCFEFSPAESTVFLIIFTLRLNPCSMDACISPVVSTSYKTRGGIEGYAMTAATGQSSEEVRQPEVNQIAKVNILFLWAKDAGKTPKKTGHDAAEEKP
jgi:hypothetical protein